MNRYLIIASACLISTAASAITVDGTYDAAYGAPTATATYDPTTPEGNFGGPTTTAHSIGYSIYLKADKGFLYGFLRADAAGGGSPVGTFANLYFDLDHATNPGSDLGFELGVNRADAFIPGVAGSVNVTGVTTAASADGLGFEFAIPNQYFTGPIAGLSYDPAQGFAAANGLVQLRLSQSFNYSVNGGPPYGPNRLGSVTLVQALPTPEPAALVLLGAGIAGIATARRRSR